MCVHICFCHSGKMAQQVKVFAAKSADMSLIFRTHMEGETQLRKAVLRLPHKHCVTYVHAQLYTRTYTLNI